MALCFILAFEEESIVSGEGRLRARELLIFHIMENRGYAGNVSFDWLNPFSKAGFNELHCVQSLT